VSKYKYKSFFEQGKKAINGSIIFELVKKWENRRKTKIISKIVKNLDSKK